jgi:hypothetical protein
MDEAMARGNATLGLVIHCLRIYAGIFYDLRNGRISVKGEFRLGGRIATWFTASPKSIQRQFLCSLATLKVAVPVMYADGQEEVVWQWLRTLYSGELNHSDDAQPHDLELNTKSLRSALQESNLTMLMILQAVRRKELDAAVAHFNQACAYMESTGRMFQEVRISDMWELATTSMACRILQLSHKHGIAEDKFDTFLEHRSLWSSHNSFAYELVSLYHPTQPSATPLLAAVSQPDVKLSDRIGYLKRSGPRLQTLMLHNLLDGTRSLVDQKPCSVKQARRVLDFVEHHFPRLSSQEGSIQAKKQEYDDSIEQTADPQIIPAFVH